MGYDRGDSFSLNFEPNGIHLVQNRKENFHHDHIPFNVKGNGNIVFSVHNKFLSVYWNLFDQIPFDEMSE